MAQIISKTIAWNAIDTLMADLRNMFDFKTYDEENHRLYITDDTYIEINVSGTSFYIKAGNSNGQLISMSASLSTNVYYEIIKSVSGDVALRTATNGVLADNMYLSFVITKVKDMNGNKSYGVFMPSKNTGAYNVGNMILICDDNTEANSTSICSNPGNVNSPSYSTFNFGFNLAAKSAVLVPAFNTFTEYITENFKCMLLTPRPYNGNCLMNGKKYYCISFFAMLDE